MVKLFGFLLGSCIPQLVLSVSFGDFRYFLSSGVEFGGKEGFGRGFCNS